MRKNSRLLLNGAMLIIIAFLLFENCACAKDNESVRTYLNMNTNWAFYRGDIPNGEKTDLDDSNWTQATIPHVMQLEKKHCGGGIIYDGVGWYRRYFRLPEKYKGKRIVISFEGVMTNCDLFMNGKKVETHHGGYMGFICDISKEINWVGDNLLAVRVSSEHDPLTPPGKLQDEMDFYYYSGIYRDVEIIVTDKLHITDALEENKIAGGGIFVTYPEVSKKKARVQVKTNIKNCFGIDKKGSLRTLLIDDSNHVIANNESPFSLRADEDKHLEFGFEVTNPSLWHPYSPHLYTLKTELLVDGNIVDDYSTPIGIRTIKYTKEDGFFINGEKLYLRGANRHQSYQNIGDAASNSMQERDAIDLKRGGFNAVRAAHYPQDPAFLDACDKYGLLVVECIPGWQFFNQDSIFIKRLYDVGRKMIRRDRNRPSVVLWETALNESVYPVALAEDLFKIAHQEYPGNQMYTAGDYWGHNDMVPCFDVLYKQVKGFPKDGNVMSNKTENLIAVRPLISREWGDGVGEKPRVSLAENEEEQMKQCRSRFRQLNGDGYFDWCMLDANPHLGGHFLWSYNDYARGLGEETLFCGVVDINRYPKFSYYMSQSMRDKSINQKGLYEGPMVYIASYNASEKFASSTTDITVFSNCEEVKLYRNGKLIGTQTRKERTPFYQSIVDKGGSPCFIFNAGNYEAGELKAEAYVNGKMAATHVVRTPDKPQHIEVYVHDAGIKPVADGSDMVPVYFKICDKNGTLVNTSNEVVDLSVSGEGSLIGGEIDRVGISPQKVEGGVGFCFVRTSNKSGQIVVTARSKNLVAGNATIPTLPYTGQLLHDGEHHAFSGKEENRAVVKPTTWEKKILEKPHLEIDRVKVSGEQRGYPASNIIDGNDTTWWIANDDSFPQSVTLSLKNPTYVSAVRVVFQKDSPHYKHLVEVSNDGNEWKLLYDREVTGWEFKPLRIEKEIRFMRITINNVSEGRAGLSEVTLFGR